MTTRNRVRRAVTTLAICMLGFSACEHSTEPDSCAGVAPVGELELAIFPQFGTLDVFVGDTLVLTTEVSEVLSASSGGLGLCEVSYGPPISAVIEWSSSNPRAATVSAAGVVVGRERGNAVITARAPALGLSASREIAVRVPGAGAP